GGTVLVNTLRRPRGDPVKTVTRGITCPDCRTEEVPYGARPVTHAQAPTSYDGAPGRAGGRWGRRWCRTRGSGRGWLANRSRRFCSGPGFGGGGACGLYARNTRGGAWAG